MIVRLEVAAIYVSLTPLLLPRLRSPLEENDGAHLTQKTHEELLATRIPLPKMQRQLCSCPIKKARKERRKLRCTEIWVFFFSEDCVTSHQRTQNDSVCQSKGRVPKQQIRSLRFWNISGQFSSVPYCLLSLQDSQESRVRTASSKLRFYCCCCCRRCCYCRESYLHVYIDPSLPVRQRSPRRSPLQSSLFFSLPSLTTQKPCSR